MISLGLPVPPAFVITTKACGAYLATGDLPDGLVEEVSAAMRYLEQETGRHFGSADKPLLVSVRSGAAISMPGMMDTILNLSVDDRTEAALAAESGDASFARNTHRRFYELYSVIVMKAGGVQFSDEETTEEWNEKLKKATGNKMPETCEERLFGAIRAVFDSWNARRAKRYRDHHAISHDLGTAVTVQTMVFGNLDSDSGTGVLFSRNPLTGEPSPYGEYLKRAQGEDVVSGKSTPQPLDTMKAANSGAYEQLIEAADILERENREMQDIEFTVQQGTLYLLQSRTGKRAPAAAVRIAIDMAREGLIDHATALERVSPEQVRILLAPHLHEGAADEAKELAHGEGACPGVGAGVVVTDPDEAERRANAGEAVILARPTTSPEDVHGMLSSKAVMTEMGGSTSHAAVVSRALGLPCVVGCGVGKLDAMAGKIVTVDGTAGRVFAGELDVDEPEERENEMARTLIEWAEPLSPLRVYQLEDVPDANVIDLSRVDGGEDTEQLGDLVQGYDGARGGAIASEEGVRAALDLKLDFIAGAPRLPLLLAAIQTSSS